MKISIITISHNSAATIAETLDSVATQSHQNIEHIVIDGASIDDTLAVVAVRGGHVSKLVSERDLGIYDAMNKGIACATGEVIGFLNSDDQLADTDVLARISTAFAQPLRPDIVYGDLVYVANSAEQSVVRYWKSGQFMRSRLKFGWMPPHPSFYVRRSFLDCIGEFDASMRIAADYDLMVRCLTRPDVRVVYLPYVFVQMRLGGASNASMASIWKKSAEDLAVMRRHRIGNWFTLASKNLRKLDQFVTPALLRPTKSSGARK